MSTYGMSALAAGVCVVALAAPTPAQAQERLYNVPAGDLRTALDAFGRQSGKPIIYKVDEVRGLHSPGYRGTGAPRVALDAILAGTGMAARVDGSGAVAIVRAGNGGSAVSDASLERGVAAEESEILVTGSRIRGKEPAGAAVTRIERKDMEQSGYISTQQILQALPQNFGGGATETTYTTARNEATSNNTFGTGINLRGLGPSSTLVLLNGERPPMAGYSGVFTDLSMIPSSMIERIEILPDGASALYGTDAVAGVVNIIPRLAFEGLETSANLGLGEGFEQIQAAAITGVSWSGGHAVLGYEYYGRSALAASDRGYFSEDLRAYGLGDFRTGPGAIPVVTAGGQPFVVPGGQDGTALTGADLTPGTGEKGDIWAGGDALPEQERHAVFGALTIDLADDWAFTAQGLFGSRHFDSRDRAGFNAQAVTVPVSNAFYADPIGTGQPVTVSYDFLPELGPEGSRGTSKAVGATAGLHWSPGGWDVGLYGTYGRQTETTEVDNIINSARLAAALADPDPATALNVFGAPSANNPATLQGLIGSYFIRGRYAMWSAALRADGPLFALPAGDVSLAVGTEYRHERYATLDALDDSATLAPVLSPGSVLGTRRVTAGYAELAVPLSSADGAGLGVGALDLSAALRGEHYSDFGDALNPKLGLSWLPVESLRLRGTFGKSFRAPSFRNMQQGLGAVQYFAYPLSDPASPTGTSNVLILSGNGSGIGPERATSWTAGVDFRPAQASGLTAQITYFDIAYRDRITNPAAGLFTILLNRSQYEELIDDSPDPAAVAAYFASPLYYNYVGLTPGQVTKIVDVRIQNLSSQRQRGIDFDLGYKLALAGGTADLGVSGSYIIDYSQKLTATTPVVTLVDTFGNPPDLRLRGRATYSGGLGGVALFANYIDGYANDSTGVPQRVGSWVTVDAQLSHEIPRGPFGKLRLALSVTNLFDDDPPLTIARSSFTTIGIDLENASPLGRVVSFQVSKQW